MMKIKIKQWIAEKEQLPSEINAEIITKTEKGIEISFNQPRTLWLPLSAVILPKEEKV